MCTRVCSKNTAFRHGCMLKWLAACHIPWVRGQLYQHRNFNNIGKSQCKAKHPFTHQFLCVTVRDGFQFFQLNSKLCQRLDIHCQLAESLLFASVTISLCNPVYCHLLMTWAPSAAETVRPHLVLFFVFSSWNLLFEALLFVLFHFPFTLFIWLFLLFHLIWGGSSYLWFLCNMEIHSWKTHPVKYLTLLSM